MTDNAALVTVGSLALLGLAYVTYGRFLARHVFQLDARRKTPAHRLEDGVDYLPTRVPVLFGHHFASIAGLGPILGPAIAVIWGWVPAVIWVVVGCIFLGAIHDLGALTVSLRYQGRSIGDVCKQLIGGRARLLFLLVIFFLMSLAMGAFVNAISSLFVVFRPDAILPSLGLMLVAMAMGVAVYKMKVQLGLATSVALLAFFGLILLGVRFPITTHEWLASPEAQARLAEARGLADAEEVFPAPYGSLAAQSYLTSQGWDAEAQSVEQAADTARTSWILVLLVYGFFASILPVWLLLQPRDYINSYQLYAALGLMAVGLTVAALTGSAENRINAEPIRAVADSPPMFPFLLVTIACGAVSGFHSLVASGTTVRQLDKETDALPIGFGAMLMEGALAILVIMACVAGLGAAAWQSDGLYSSWSGVQGGGLGRQLAAVVNGGGQFLLQVGVPVAFGRAFLAVTIVAFALTTLDSATRLLRFNVEEIFRSIGFGRLANRYLASLIAVGGIAFFGLTKGGATLWILFGTMNQLLAGLTLLTVSLFLFKLGRNMWFTLVPMGIMLAVSISAILYSVAQNWPRTGQETNWNLLGVSLIVLAMALWLIAEAILSFLRGRGNLGLPEELFDEAPEKEIDRVTPSAST
jgi:carbon starvation protein